MKDLCSYSHVHLSPSILDMRVWSSSSLGPSIAKSFLLVQSNLLAHVHFYPTNFIWQSKVSSKVKAFAWLVVNKKVDTNYPLWMGRPDKALGLDCCIMCMRSGELIYHLFEHYLMTLGL